MPKAWSVVRQQVLAAVVTYGRLDITVALQILRKAISCSPQLPRAHQPPGNETVWPVGLMPMPATLCRDITILLKRHNSHHGKHTHTLVATAW